MPDVRELFESHHEVLETERDTARSNVRSGYPVQVSKDTEHGHIVELQPMVKFQYMTPDGEIKSEEMTKFMDVPIRYQRGGGMVQTHPVKKGDIGWWIPMSRDFSPTMKDDGIQDPGSSRTTSLSDGYFSSGFRPDPQDEKVMGKEGKRFSKDTHQLRSDDGRHTRDSHPGDPDGDDKEKKKKGGFIDKSVHHEDETKREDNPFADAKKYTEHRNIGAKHVKTTVMVKKADSEDKHYMHESEHDYEGHKVGTGDKDGPRKHFVDLHEKNAYKMSVERDSHYHTCTKEGGHFMSCDKGKHTFEMKPGSSINIKTITDILMKATQKVTSDTPEHKFTKNITVNKDADVQGDVRCTNCHAKNQVTGQQITGQQGMFGSLGGIGGGAMGGGGGSAGSGSGIGAGAMESGAAAKNVANDPTGWNNLPNCADDAAAALAGVDVGKLYRFGSHIMVRVT